MLLLFSIRVAELSPVWERAVQFTVHVFHECLSVCVLVSFPFGSGSGVWDLIVLVPDHCLSFYFTPYIHYRDPNKMTMNISAKVQNFRP